ncbi:MAG TPA: hypothetical protein VLB04_12750 [Methanotrichaceae archaeon]|nr:hypothetical protein [Methanotrichaceae archaeon]
MADYLLFIDAIVLKTIVLEQIVLVEREAMDFSLCNRSPKSGEHRHCVESFSAKKNILDSDLCS